MSASTESTVHADDNEVSPDRYKIWVEEQFEIVKMAIEAGWLDNAEYMLVDRWTNAIRALNNKNYDAGISGLYEALAEARVRETIGGPGSLVIPEHRYTKIINEHRAYLADIKASWINLASKKASVTNSQGHG